MRCLAANLGALVCALVLPVSALAVGPVAHAAAAPVHVATGTVTTNGWTSLTIQTAGRQMGVINALTDTATAITKRDYTYVWGGGHAEAGVASVGIKGPGYNGRTAGFDCSGSVAAVLSGAGLWPAGSGVPNDAGVISELLSEHLIARGAGTPPDEVTLYDDPGVHIFMNIDGRFFGTSDGGGGGDRRGGAGWLNDGAADAYDRSFKQYHFLPSVLHDRTSYGHSLTFETGQNESLIAGVQVGDKLHITYVKAKSGVMSLSAIAYVGSVTATGTVTSLTAGGGSFVIQGANGQSLTFSTGILKSLIDGLVVGDQVQVSYTRSNGALAAHTVTVTAQPAPVTPTPVTSTPAPPTPVTPTTESATIPGAGWNSGSGGYGGHGGSGGSWGGSGG